MRLLIITFYYPPDLSAGSFRVRELVKSLQIKERNLDIHVITTQPNRYHELSNDFKIIEKFKQLTIHRLTIPRHKNTMFGQIISFSIFALKALKFTRKKKWDYIFSTSSRLMTAFLSALISNKSNTPLFLDIRDIFSDTMKSYYNNFFIKLLLPLINSIEKYTIKAAKKIYFVSPAFPHYFKKYDPSLRYKIITNGIDDEFLNFDFKKELTQKNSKKIILYAGNVGEGQGLENILPKLAKNLKNNFVIWVVGSGGKLLVLKEKVKKMKLENIIFFPPVNREKLKKIYKDIDILFLHLNSYSSNKKVLPSKIFEYGAIGKPIIAGVFGESYNFMKKELPNCYFFDPLNYKKIIKKINSNEIIVTELNEKFKKKFNRKKIMNEFTNDILNEMKSLK
tara:strand:- start:96 stop:1277 length:1182 start_codon:yes stop_codon:yes gene_type:complete